MAAERGRGFLLQVQVAGVFTQLGGMQTNSLTFNNEVVDVTNKGSLGFRTLLEAGGVRSLELNVTGIFDDDAGYRIMRNAVQNGAHISCRMLFETGDVIEGQFAVASVQNSGEYNGAVNYTISLQSANSWTYTG